jgi:hypothetical protein
MWALVIFAIATTGPAASTVTLLEFATQHLCLIAERQLESLTEPIVSEGLVRYEVVATCVQVSEESRRNNPSCRVILIGRVVMAAMTRRATNRLACGG